jgi:DNA-binding NarL/FixJ family response regulator
MRDTVDPVMPARIAISDPLPVFRRGIVATLGDMGFAAESPQDLLAWVRQEQRRVVALTLQSAEDWDLLAALRQARADLIVVAVLTDVQVSTYVRAVRAGAAAAVPRDAPPDAMKRVLQAAVDGASLLPVEVVQALAARQPPQDEGESEDEGAGGTSADEIRWLRELAAGVTVARLAEQAGYSERAMFRLLRDLYARMHVRNRTEALMSARERGWV